MHTIFTCACDVTALWPGCSWVNQHVRSHHADLRDTWGEDVRIWVLVMILLRVECIQLLRVYFDEFSFYDLHILLIYKAEFTIQFVSFNLIVDWWPTEDITHCLQE